jgi:hypothetical protein
MPELGSDDPAQPQRLGALDIDLAPQVPGIYAWYASLALSDHDWKPRIQGGIDLAAHDLDRAISDYAHVHHPEPLDLRAEGSYNLNWSGALQRDSISDPGASGPASRLELQLHSLSADPESRRLLTSLLRAAAPIFASPLYIGVATNLRSRLAVHIADYEAAKAALRNNPSESAALHFGGDSFGARLAGAGIQLERLECWVLPAVGVAAAANNQMIAIDGHRSVAGTAEWILQRIFRPVLGRH